MTRSGDINRVGAFVFSDCPLRTLMRETLDAEAVKALMDVREACALPARYHEAVLPARHARLFSANSGVDATGQRDDGYYFDTYRQWGLAAMARKDLRAVNGASDDMRAVCRRVVMFALVPGDIGLQTRILEDAASATYASELAVQAAYYGESEA